MIRVFWLNDENSMVVADGSTSYNFNVIIKYDK
jgi:hypothetical protein